jgi:RNA-directed DNA polymerase
MKRWSKINMVSFAKTLFAKHYQTKRLAHWNHDIHLLHRDKTWIEAGIEHIIDGSYNPGCIERFYFSDERCDSIPVRDRVLLRVIFEELKPTFKHVISPYCYHLLGPNGVRKASADIRQALAEKKPQYFIRADIKSFFASIPHELLIKDINTYYDDPQLGRLLEQVIKTPIKTPNGYINPDKGIALRSPLSNFFSGVYLKVLDDCLTACDVDYFRYQDDVLILCKSLRSYKRCQVRLKRILEEKRLSLSAKKTKMGSVKQGFHFLGIDYLWTQTIDNSSNSQGVEKESTPLYLRRLFHADMIVEEHDGALAPPPSFLITIPHARTLRRAREQVRAMVADGASLPQIKVYLSLWASWWHYAASTWTKETLLHAWQALCWDKTLTHYALADYPVLKP